MAHGLNCRHCGWQEAAHEQWQTAADEIGVDPDALLDGYLIPITMCSGFEYAAGDKAEVERRESTEGGQHDGCH